MEFRSHFESWGQQSVLFWMIACLSNRLKNTTETNIHGKVCGILLTCLYNYLSPVLCSRKRIREKARKARKAKRAKKARKAKKTKRERKARKARKGKMMRYYSGIFRYFSGISHYSGILRYYVERPASYCCCLSGLAFSYIRTYTHYLSHILTHIWRRERELNCS